MRILFFCIGNQTHARVHPSRWSLNSVGLGSSKWRMSYQQQCLCSQNIKVTSEVRPNESRVFTVMMDKGFPPPPSYQSFPPLMVATHFQKEGTVAPSSLILMKFRCGFSCGSRATTKSYWNFPRPTF